MTTPTISGIHHITAVASAAAENLTFYQDVLGLRLVKRTVNFDDPTTYHLYYGDGAGTPGTIMTFFPWENLPAGRPGAGMIVATAFSIPRHAIDYWNDRLAVQGIPAEGGRRFGEPLIQFKDPHGLPLELIGVSLPPASVAWRQSTVAPEHAILGFHSATALLNSLDPTDALLADSMGMRLLEKDGRRFRFAIGPPPAPGRFFDVVVDPAAAQGLPGGGTVHHIAFRTPTAGEQLVWRSQLMQAGFPVTPVRDRSYFRSIYFHEPGGVLFEIATDPPGFTVDEPLELLGRQLKLPPQYEPMRRQIEAQLPDLGRLDPGVPQSPARQKKQIAV
jgi:glyoxalase family protein